MRGLVHEGFAQPAVLEPTDALLVLKRPPPPLHEFPPVLRPAPSATIWLPGYWGWDDSRDDFIWISGVWRIPPPGMRWLPGYWSARDEQFAWTPGFWFPTERAHLQYHADPPPPAPAEADQLAAADQFYVPGYWVKAGDGYVWRRSHEAPFHEGWVWMPTRYVSTPAGSVLTRGYWDYPLARRGVLFAPVSLPHDSETPAAFTPEVALNIGKLGDYLFAWPAYNHYCFGDYFDDAAREQKIQPWFADANDSLYSYERWHRSHVQRDWQKTVADQYERRRRDAQLRPARTFDEFGAAGGGELAFRLKDWPRASGAPLALTTLSYEALSNAARAAEAIALLASSRAKFETAASDESSAGRPRALALPAPAAPPAEPRGVPRVGTTGEYVPGVSGREVPGYGRRALPGMAGRTVPGVDTNAPGVVGPGVAPGADTRTSPGADLSKPQLPQRP